MNAPPALPAACCCQGAFRRVAAEVEACTRELAALLRRRLAAAPDEAAETIQMIAKLGEPTEALQVGVAHTCGLHSHGGARQPIRP